MYLKPYFKQTLSLLTNNLHTNAAILKLPHVSPISNIFLQRNFSFSVERNVVKENIIGGTNVRLTSVPSVLHLKRNLSFSVIRNDIVKENVDGGTAVHSRLAEPLEWSYLNAGGTLGMLGLTLGQVLDRAARLYGDREAVVSMHQGLRKTYSDLHKDSTAMAAGLASLAGPGARVGLWSPNCYEWIVTQFAVAKAGLVLVNINPAYRPLELEYCLKKVAVEVLVCAESFRSTNYAALLGEVAPELAAATPGRLRSARLPALRSVVAFSGDGAPPSGTFSFEELCSGLAGPSHHDAVQAITETLQCDQPANIQFTSGTTGQPKGAVLSHHNIVNNAHYIGARGGYGKQHHRICVPVPLYHCFGCVGGSLLAALYGATCVLPSQGFSGDAVITALEEESITSCYGTPTMFVDVLAAARRRGLRPPPSLFTGIMAGAPCPQHLVKDVDTELNITKLTVMYGMTETSPVSFQCFPDDPLHVRCTTVGFPSDHLEVKVVDREGRVVRAGVEGEVCVRGYSVFLGYWEDEEKTKEAIGPDRWFKTGDLGSLDAQGYGCISGRIKDVVIRGGENIYPAELENFFLTHPAVMEAQVFGVPDPRLGEEAAVWLRLRPQATLTEEHFKAWCKDKIASYKVPRYVLFKEDFPVTVTGKVQKFKMREQTTKELGLED